MKRVRDPKTLLYNDHAVKVGMEFSNLIEPFIDKHFGKYSPEELESIMTGEISMNMCRKVINFRQGQREKALTKAQTNATVNPKK